MSDGKRSGLVIAVRVAAVVLAAGWLSLLFIGPGYHWFREAVMYVSFAYFVSVWGFVLFTRAGKRHA